MKFQRWLKPSRLINEVMNPPIGTRAACSGRLRLVPKGKAGQQMGISRLAPARPPKPLGFSYPPLRFRAAADAGVIQDRRPSNVGGVGASTSLR